MQPQSTRGDHPDPSLVGVYGVAQQGRFDAWSCWRRARVFHNGVSGTIRSVAEFCSDFRQLYFLVIFPGGREGQRWVTGCGMGQGFPKRGWCPDPWMCPPGSRDENPGIWFLNTSTVTEVTREPGFCLGLQKRVLAQLFAWSPCWGSCPVQLCP